ncbi:type IV pilus twitching motility protein PilT [Soehngenia longivitae]|uniref:Type IV pilus twitching motility protein PilT n=1 Tax=Soehngenia longivitae TaxID=2562294 RepID=A0A4Z0D742_9FIRM|nr:type IV pilus twitching motility protein PilT [Soehngenia longivitae]TFZ40679.1 type IV pilus twitching motility protein PilT [Soehngenia longivitae]
MEIEEIVLEGIQRKASDIHITVGIPPTFRIDGELVSFGNKKLYPEDTEYLVKQTMNELQFEKFIETGEYDFSYSIQGMSRFRVNAYKQRGSFGMALRIIPYDIPTMQFLGLPSVIEELTELNRGLILVTGPTGSGKSTTLATMIDKINSNRRCHIITLEDPIEYLHKHDKSIINQREIGTDTKSFANALRGALREDPDVILVGEMRDLDTISIAITAAETGHLVLSTLHTIGAPQTIDRIIDVFPPYQQQQVRIQLSSVIQAIITQQLLPKADGNGRIAAFEVMIATPAIRNLIRESKVHQIETAMLTGTKNKMQTMDNSLLQLYKTGKITKDMAISRAISQEEIKKYL